MSEAAIKPEPQPHVPSSQQRILVGTILLSSLAIGTGAGAFGGYEGLGETQVSSDHDAAIAQATRDTNCARVVERLAGRGSETAVVHISALSNQEQADCGADWVIPLITNPNSTNSLQSRVVSTKVELPSLTSLYTNARHETAAAANVTDTSYKVAGVVLGGFVGLLGSVVTISGGLALNERRRKKNGTPPAEATQAATS
jgi:hypothetical protein